MAFREGVIERCYNFIVIFVAFVSFLAGLVVAAVFIGSHGKPPELWEIGPELRQDADHGFADYKAGKIVYTVMLPLLDTHIKARVVKQYRNVDHGFVPMSELGPMPTHFWYYNSGEFGLWKYNDDFLFVTIRERYARELERRSNESELSRSPREREK